jgi:disulfide bond formation protein DsbB
MTLTPRAFAGFVLIASAAVLGTALLSQYWGGLAPCDLCLQQRWPWSAAIAISLIALLVGNRPALPWVALILAVVFATSVAFASYHVGVEQHWFAGPTACTGGGTAATSMDELRRQILATAPVRCDEVPWSLFGVSLAGLNLLASLVMVALCAAVFVSVRTPASRVVAA